MSSSVNRQWLVTQRPTDRVRESDFLLVESPVPEPAEGEFLVKIMYLAATQVLRQQGAGEDPRPSGLTTGQVMRGRGVGRVVASRHTDYRVGDIVQGAFGWQEYALCRAEARDMVHVVRQRLAPFSTALGVLGPKGFTAYLGLVDVGQPVAGDTVVITGGGGGVATHAGRIARLLGAGRLIGIAGSPLKCREMVESLGYDAAINHRREDLDVRLRELAPGGVDVFFDNVGGRVLDTVLGHINKRARIVFSGRVSEKTGQQLEEQRIRNYWAIGRQQARMEGLYIYDRQADFHRAEQQMAEWIHQGRLAYSEERLEGIQSMPEALQRAFKHRNAGKLVVRIDPEADSPG